MAPSFQFEVRRTISSGRNEVGGLCLNEKGFEQL